jgi:hypothetical protein
MISPEMFDTFLMPNLERCLRLTNHGFYHLDGKGAIPHLDRLLSLPPESLRGIQWVPGAGQPGPQRWMPLLKRIKDCGKLCHISLSPEGALEIVRELGGKGFAFVVYPRKTMSAEDVDDYLALLAKEDSSP